MKKYLPWMTGDLKESVQVIDGTFSRLINFRMELSTYTLGKGRFVHFELVHFKG